MKWDAKLYNSVVAPQVDAGRKLVGMAKVKGDEHVLDLGCGTGILTDELASLARWGRVVGLDPSEEMLAEARARLGLRANVVVVRGDACALEFSGDFDLVFTNSVLHWAPCQAGALQGIHRALVPGGRLAMQMPEVRFFPQFEQYIREATDELSLGRYFKGWGPKWCLSTRDEYAALMVEAGFRDIDVSVWEQTYLFESVNEIAGWLSSAGLRPYMARLPEDKQERFTYAFAMRFENDRTPDGIVVTMRRLMAQARK
jgi:trans-aconitate methyltransferase